MTNNGRLVFKNHSILCVGGALIRNRGTITLQGDGADPWGDAAIFDNSGSQLPPPQLLNSGRIEKTGGTETAFIYARTDNSGTIAVDSGTLAIGVGNTDNGGVDTGSYTIASEATLDFAGGTRTLGTGSSITGTGTLKISSGGLDISRSVGTVGDLKVVGTLRVTLERSQLSGGNGYLRVSNQADIASGTVQVTSAPGFCGQLFDSAVLLIYGSSNGHFRQERFDAGGQAMSIVYTTGSVNLRIDSANCDVKPPTVMWAKLDTLGNRQISCCSAT